MPEERPAIPPALGLVVAVLAVSFAAPLFRLAEAPPLTASFWRLAFAVVLLAPFSRPAVAQWRTWSVRRWMVVALSGVALGAHFGLWVTSLFHITVAAAVSLVTLQAVFVAIGGHLFLRDRLRWLGWAGVLVAVAGTFVLSAGRRTALPGGDAGFGITLAVLGGVASALYMLIGRRVRRDADLVAYVLPVYAVAALSVLVALPVVGQPLTTGLPLRSFGVFVLLAAVPMLGGHTMANWCLRHLGAHVVATWILLEPVGAALLAWPLLGEVPGGATVFGGALVLLGAIATVRPAATSRIRSRPAHR